MLEGLLMAPVPSSPFYPLYCPLLPSLLSIYDLPPFLNPKKNGLPLFRIVLNSGRDEEKRPFFLSQGVAPRSDSKRSLFFPLLASSLSKHSSQEREGGFYPKMTVILSLKSQILPSESVLLSLSRAPFCLFPFL